MFLYYMSFSIDSVDTASYADDNTPYTIWKNKCEVEKKLEIASVKLFKRFYKKRHESKPREV